MLQLLALQDRLMGGHVQEGEALVRFSTADEATAALQKSNAGQALKVGERMATIALLEGRAEEDFAARQVRAFGQQVGSLPCEPLHLPNSCHSAVRTACALLLPAVPCNACHLPEDLDLAVCAMPCDRASTIEVKSQASAGAGRQV